MKHEDDTREYGNTSRSLALFISISICIGFSTLGFSIDRLIRCVEERHTTMLYSVNTVLVFLTSLGIIFGGFALFSSNVKRLENRMKDAGLDATEFIRIRNQKRRQIGFTFVAYTMVYMIFFSLTHAMEIQLLTIIRHPMETIATPLMLFLIGAAFIIQSTRNR